MPEPSTCEAIQYSDQKRCDRCNLVWDMNDPDPPECVTIAQAAINQALELLAS